MPEMGAINMKGLYSKKREKKVYFKFCRQAKVQKVSH